MSSLKEEAENKDGSDSEERGKKDSGNNVPTVIISPTSISKSSPSLNTPDALIVKTNGSVISASTPMLKSDTTHLSTSSLTRRNNGAHSSQDLSFHVDRPIFTQEAFDEDFSPLMRKSKTPKDRLKEMIEKFECSPSCWKKFLFSIFPFLQIMKDYSIKEDLLSDAISGLTVGVMHIPQGMAYGMLALIPPVYGLYVSFFPVIIYFFFGTSKHISIGTFAVISLMVGSAVSRYEDDCRSLAGGEAITESPNETTTSVFNITIPPVTEEEPHAVIMCKLGVATAVTFMAGIIQNLEKLPTVMPGRDLMSYIIQAKYAGTTSQINAAGKSNILCNPTPVSACGLDCLIIIAMGLLRLGFVTIYLSESLTRGFTTGAAVHVFTSQVKHAFGINTKSYNGPLKLIFTYIDLFRNIASTNVAALVTAVICMVILYVTKEYVNPRVKRFIKMPIPVELFVVIFGTLVSYLAKFNMRFNVKVVGDIPTGIPVPRVPDMSRVGGTITDAIGLAIVGFAISVSMAKLFAKKNAYDVDANQELVAYGLSNFLSSFFSCFVSAASLSRSLIQESVGGKTQVAGLISCVLILIVLLALGPLFTELPNACLAAIIIVALQGMFMQFKDLKRLWRVDIFDFLIWLVTFLATVLLEVDLGLLVGVGFSLLTVIFRTQRPHTCILGRIPHTDIYKDAQVYKSVHEIEGIKIFRFESSLLYANLEHFTSKLFKKTDINPRTVKLQRLKRQKKRAKKLAEQEKKVKALGAQVLEDAQQEEDTMQLDEKEDELPIHTIILDCTTMGYTDSAGVALLLQVILDYQSIGVTVYLAGCKASVRQLLEAGGFYEKIDRRILCLSIHDAVVMALEKDPDILQQVITDVIIRHSSLPVIRLETPVEESDFPIPWSKSRYPYPKPQN